MHTWKLLGTARRVEQNVRAVGYEEGWQAEPRFGDSTADGGSNAARP